LANRLTAEIRNGVSRSYDYDLANQLTQDGGNSFSYDLNGNRTLTGYVTGANNRLLSDGTLTYTYDAEGNQTQSKRLDNTDVWSYSYDHRNQLIAAEHRATLAGSVDLRLEFKYDVFNRRIERSRDPDGDGSATATVTRFAFDGQNIWADLDASSSLTMRRLFGDGADQVLTRLSSTNVVAWYLTDRLGSVREMADNSGVLQETIGYGAYGNIESETNPSFGDSRKFTAKELESDFAWQLHQDRWLIVSIGRWNAEDPIWVYGGDANLYGYVRNSPTNFTDPTGQQLTAELLRQELTGAADPAGALAGLYRQQLQLSLQVRAARNANAMDRSLGRDQPANDPRLQQQLAQLTARIRELERRLAPEVVARALSEAGQEPQLRALLRPGGYEGRGNCIGHEENRTRYGGGHNLAELVGGVVDFLGTFIPHPEDIGTGLQTIYEGVTLPDLSLGDRAKIVGLGLLVTLGGVLDLVDFIPDPSDVAQRGVREAAEEAVEAARRGSNVTPNPHAGGPGPGGPSGPPPSNPGGGAGGPGPGGPSGPPPSPTPPTPGGPGGPPPGPPGGNAANTIVVTPSGVAVPQGIQGTSPLAGQWTRTSGSSVNEALSRVPANWTMAQSQSGTGVIFRDPANPAYNWVRIMAPDPNYGNTPYLRVFRNGTYVDGAGNAVPWNSPAGHIPLTP